MLAQFENPQVLLNPDMAAALHQAVSPALFDALFGAIKIGLVNSLHDVFLVGAVLGAIGVVLVLFLQELPLRKTYAPAPLDSPESAAAQVGEDAFPSLPPLRPGAEPVPLASVRRAS